tara:strand:+ start:1070 stop:1279 length:210 start_codon:yes stop_codon:yes gene_type:complete
VLSGIEGERWGSVKRQALKALCMGFYSYSFGLSVQSTASNACNVLILIFIFGRRIFMADCCIFKFNFNL